MLESNGAALPEIVFPFITEGQEHYTPFTAQTGKNPYVKARLTYTLPGQAAERTKEISGMIRTRSSKSATGETLQLISKHKNRDMASKALITSAEQAERNELEAARKTLRDAIKAIQDSLSKTDPLCLKLIADCTAALDGLQDRHTFDLGGQAVALASAYQHSGQSGTFSLGIYATSSVSMASISAQSRARQ